MNGTNALKASIESAYSVLKRMNSIDDPVLRYSLFLETLRATADFGLRSLEVMLENQISQIDDELDDIPKEVPEKDFRATQKITKTKEKLRSDLTITEAKRKEVFQEFMKYMDSFSLWIKQPVYGPDDSKT